MPATIVPMKPTLADQPPHGDEWLFEIKWDGVRAIAFIDERRGAAACRATAIRCEQAVSRAQP